MAVKEETYLELISKSDVDVRKEQLVHRNEEAKIEYKQGLLSVQKKMLDVQSKVSKLESTLKSAENELLSARKSAPHLLVQNLVNAKVKIKQSTLDLQSAMEELNEYQELYNFLEETEKVLFKQNAKK